MRYTKHNAHLAIAERIDFKTAGALQGGNNLAWMGRGILPVEFYPQYNEARQRQLEHDASLYIVYSYSTPIGWDIEGEIVIPDTKYSVTTSIHQTQCRLGLKRAFDPRTRTDLRIREEECRQQPHRVESLAQSFASNDAMTVRFDQSYVDADAEIAAWKKVLSND